MDEIKQFKEVDTKLTNELELTINNLESASKALYTQFYKIRNRLNPFLKQKTLFDYV